MNHSPADDSGREAASRVAGRERLDLAHERMHAPAGLQAWHDRFAATSLPALLKERLHLKFRDLRSHRHEREAGEVRALVSQLTAAAALGQLPALTHRLGQAAAITAEATTAASCFASAASTLPDGPARSIALQNLLMIQLDRRENAAVIETLGALARTAPLDLPLPLDRFVIERPLGLSMFGMVFLCREKVSGRRVVVKSPPDSLPGRFPPHHEADILRRVAHRGVPACFEQGYVDPAGRRPYYVVEWFDGLSLHDYVARYRTLAWANFRPIVTALVETLQALHAEQIIHCDLKPGNVLVRCDHEGWQVKLIDFGIAIRADDPAAQIVPNEPRPFTMGFGAPEQQGQTQNERLTTAADIYGLGRTILFCLCGQPDPPVEARDLLPAGIASLVAGCLSSDPLLRPSAAELLEQLALLPAPDGVPRFPSTHLTAGTSSSVEHGTQDSASPDDRSDTRMPPRPPGTG